MNRKSLIKPVLIAGLVGFGAFWLLTLPKTIDPSKVDQLTGSAEKGALVFAAAGCSSCHSAKDGDPLILSGGRAFPSDFGTFYAPNISPNAENGLGNWTLAEFATALKKGVSPKRKHYYPAFPYTTYQNMELTDIADLFAYLKTLPAASNPSIAHDVAFPFSIRRGLGLWKRIFMPNGFHMPDTGLNATEKRGRYLVEAMGHCTECHTPRNFLGGLMQDRWLAGGPNSDGKGRIPNITPHADGIGGWEEIDVVTYLNSGFTPEYDSAGGAMVEVIENMKHLPESDLKAIAAHLRNVDPKEK